MADEINKAIHIIIILTYHFIIAAPPAPPITEERTEEGKGTSEEIVDRQGNYIINIITAFSEKYI